MKQGFSLLELSIVLVIIGLIAGGIVAGSSMIRAAELRSVITEQEQYKIAMNTFRDKYFAIPGDMKNATAFWGIAAGTGDDATCAAFESAGKETCNGNGDSNIHNGAIPLSEIYRSWQHLANADLINGQFTGAEGSSGYADGTPGVNQPQSKVSGAGWTLWNLTSAFAHWSFGDNSISLWIGANSGNTNAYTFYPIFTPQEAWNIDKKLDDGKPGLGNVLTHSAGYTPSCTSTVVADTAEYLIADEGTLCNLIFNVK